MVRVRSSELVGRAGVLGRAVALVGLMTMVAALSAAWLRRAAVALESLERFADALPAGAQLAQDELRPAPREGEAPWPPVGPDAPLEIPRPGAAPALAAAAPAAIEAPRATAPAREPVPRRGRWACRGPCAPRGPPGSAAASA